MTNYGRDKAQSGGGVDGIRRTMSASDNVSWCVPARDPRQRQRHKAIAQTLTSTSFCPLLFHQFLVSCRRGIDWAF